MEPVVSAALSEAVKAVVDKLKEGKKLSVEDLLLLYLGTVVDELRAIRMEMADRDKSIRAEIGEMNKRIDETNKRIDEMGKRIDEANKRIDEANKRIDETNKRIDAMAERIDKRIDDLYKLLSNIYQALLDISRQLSAK